MITNDFIAREMAENELFSLVEFILNEKQ